MLLDKIGQSMVIDGKTYAVGMSVYSTDESDYRGLYGKIIEIADGEDKSTDNETVDITCEFYVPDDISQVTELEERFSALYGEPKEIDDISLDYVIMAPDMIRSVKRCRIYQITPADSEFVFRGYDSVTAKGLKAPPAELYKVVFDGQLETDNLEDIFHMFNLAHPDGYCGRSLSMSDIVELYDADSRSFHYCDTFGFTEITFVPIT